MFMLCLSLSRPDMVRRINSILGKRYLIASLIIVIRKKMDLGLAHSKPRLIELAHSLIRNVLVVFKRDSIVAKNVIRRKGPSVQVDHLKPPLAALEGQIPKEQGRAVLGHLIDFNGMKHLEISESLHDQLEIVSLRIDLLVGEGQSFQDVALAG